MKILQIWPQYVLIYINGSIKFVKLVLLCTVGHTASDNVKLIRRLSLAAQYVYAASENVKVHKKLKTFIAWLPK